MSALIAIGGMAAGLYALRIGGFLMARAKAASAWESALAFVPVATLTALTVSALAPGTHERVPRLIAAAVAALAARRAFPAWASISGGLTVYWFLRVI